MTDYRYQIDPRPAELGGGWNLKLFQGDLEVGGGVFPVNADADPHAGMDWFNGLQERERARWLQTAGSARPVDAWSAYLSAKAYQDALEHAESWLAPYLDTSEPDQSTESTCPKCGGRAHMPTRWGMSYPNSKCDMCGEQFSFGHTLILGATSSGKTAHYIFLGDSAKPEAERD